MCKFSTQYPVINDGISIHFWDKLSIITDESGILSTYSDVKYEVNEQYTDVLELCNGINSVENICQRLSDLYNGNTNDNSKATVAKMIKQLHTENIVHFENAPSVPKKFWGERGLTYPIHVSIEVTNKCNFSCNFCYKDANIIGTCIDPTIIDNIYSLIGEKTKTVQFTGGEPFLCNNIDKYIDMFKNHNISIITNGSLLFTHDDSILKKISLYQISLYGSNEHEYTTNTHNTIGWNNIMLSIQKLNRIGCKYHLSVVLNKENYLKIEDYVRAALKLNAKKIVFGTQTPVGRGMNSGSCLSIDEFRIAYRLMRLVHRKYNDNIEIEEWSHNGYQTSNSKSINDLQNKSYQGLLGCGSGTSQFVISQNGKVRPCELLPESYFDLGGIEVIQQAIHGKYLDNSITYSAKRFNNELCKHGKDFTHFCEPFERLLKEYTNDDTKATT